MADSDVVLDIFDEVFDELVGELTLEVFKVVYNEERQAEDAPEDLCRVVQANDEELGEVLGEDLLRQLMDETFECSEFLVRDDLTVVEQDAPDEDEEAPEASEREKLRAYVKESRNKNTNKKTEQCMTRFRESLREFGEGRNPEEIPSEELDTYIGSFLRKLKKKDGGDMEPDSLTSLHRGIERYLRDCGYQFDILSSEKFRMSRDVLEAKRRKLKAEGKGNKPNKASILTNEDVEKFWDSGQMGKNDGKALQNALFYYFTQCFGFRGCHESRNLCWGDVELVERDDMSYLEFVTERVTKTRTGSAASGTRAFNPKIFAIGGERCPVHLYKELLFHRPASMTDPEAPFFLAVKTKIIAGDPIWYAKAPLGKNSLQKIVAEMSRNVGLVGKYTNHSIRKKTCNDLLNASFSANSIVQITGHKNVQSLNNYAVADINLQKRMCDVLTQGSQRPDGDERVETPAARPDPRPQAPEPRPSTSTSTENVDGGDQPAPAKKVRLSAEERFEKLVEATKGMFAGSKIDGNVTINFNYNMYSSKKATVNVSPAASQNSNS